MLPPPNFSDMEAVIKWIAEQLAATADAIVETLSAMADDLEPEEARPEPPYRIFFVRTVPHHLIPWYTSGFQ